MQWTNEPPSSSGYYWFKGRTSEMSLGPTVCEVLGTEVAFTGNEITELIDSCNGWWAGPIQQPDE